MELELALRKYNPSQIRHLAFLSAHREHLLDGKIIAEDTVIAIKNLPYWFRYSRWDFPETWEFVDRYTIILKNPPINLCTKAQWDAIVPITHTATAALLIYFWLNHLITTHGYGVLVAKQDISDIIGISNSSVRKGIELLRKRRLINGYFPNGWPMQIIAIAPFDQQEAYIRQRRLACKIQSPDGKIYSIPWGGQKKFAQRHGININTLSKICHHGVTIAGWKLV